MEYAPLGRTDLTISRVGFGCWAIGGHGYGVVDDDASRAAIRGALGAGINFFDTADVYGFGHSEEVLSSGLGEDRHTAVIATKFGVGWTLAGKTYKDCGPARAVEALDASLRRLRIDCIPLYQIHCHDGVTRLEDTMEALCRCRDAGKIRHIGCTNFTLDHVAAAHRVEPMASIQLEFNLLDREHEATLRQCFSANRMSTIVYGALVRGLLSGKYGQAAEFGNNDTRSIDPEYRGPQLTRNLALVEALQSTAARYGRSAGQTALRWVLDLPFISSVIVGMKNADQVVQNVGASGWRLSREDWDALSQRAAPAARVS